MSLYRSQILRQSVSSGFQPRPRLSKLNPPHQLVNVQLLNLLDQLSWRIRILLHVDGLAHDRDDGVSEGLDESA
jgi:hypothetical protein